MALSKEQIDIIANNYVIGLYQGMEQEVINDIARRINKTGRYTETAEIQARNLRELGFSTSEIQTKVLAQLHADEEYKKMIAKNTRAYKQEIKEIIKEVEAEALANGEDMIATAGTMAWNDDLQMWAAHGVDLKKPSELSLLQKAFVKQTKSQLRNISRTTAFIGTAFGSTGVLNAYQRAMDLTALKVATGMFSYKQAVADTIKDLSKSFGTIDYANGRKYHVDTAVRMIVRTTTSQLAGKITEMNCDSTDCSYVYVDAHPGSRPEHAAWQGKVYTYKGKATKKYPDFFKTTDYGSVTGLKGVNCTHNFYPYWLGDPIEEYKEPDPVTVDGKKYSYYDATQKQRGMERQIRETKREINALKATKDPAHNAEIAAKTAALKTQTDKYKDFSNKAGIDPQMDRLKVYDSISAAQKAMPPKGLASGTIGMGEEKHPAPILLESGLEYTEKNIKEKLLYYEGNIKNSPIENAIVFTSKGNLYQCYGTKNGVRPDLDLGEELRGASLTHNHPEDSAQDYNFSSSDLKLFGEYELKFMRGFDTLSEYELSRFDNKICCPATDYGIMDAGAAVDVKLAKYARYYGYGFIRQLK